MKKKIVIITQSKGGAGKSILTFMAAEKYKQAVVLDLDSAEISSTQIQLAYRKPVKVSFLDEQSQSIDRVAFNNLFRSITGKKEDLFLLDLGASVAEQLPIYFNINGADVIAELLDATGLELEIVCVVNGANNFKHTAQYLLDLVESVKGKLSVKVAYNLHFPFSSDQKSEIDKFIADHKLTMFSYDLAKDKTAMSMRSIEEVLKAGKGIGGLDPFTAMYFKKSIEELPL